MVLYCTVEVNRYFVVIIIQCAECVLMMCSDRMAGLQLGQLKPLWHLYLKLMSKHGPSDTGVRPPLMLALTELFLAVEIAAEVCLAVLSINHCLCCK